MRRYRPTDGRTERHDKANSRLSQFCKRVYVDVLMAHLYVSQSTRYRKIQQVTELIL
jgi:hypothetical protein